MSSELNTLLAGLETDHLAASHAALKLGPTVGLNRSQIVAEVKAYIERLVAGSSITPGQLATLIEEAIAILQGANGHVTLAVILQILALVQPYLHVAQAA